MSSLFTSPAPGSSWSGWWWARACLWQMARLWLNVRAIHTHTAGISHRQHFSLTWKMLRDRKTFIYLEEILIASIIRNGILVSLSWWWCLGESLQWRDTKQMDWGTAIRRTKCDFKSPTKSDHSIEESWAQALRYFNLCFNDKNFYLHKIFLPIWATKFQKSNIYVKDILKNIPCILSPGWDSLPENI